MCLISARGWVFSLSFEYYVAWAVKLRGTYGMTEARSLPTRSITVKSCS